MIVYLARAIQAFVMYCVNGTSRSSLLIESTDSMIPVYIYIAKIRAIERTRKFASLAIIDCDFTDNCEYYLIKMFWL